MKHLVTGGSGFLGNLIARRLHARGELVRVLDLWEDNSRPKEIEFVHCDIRDASGVGRAMIGVEVVQYLTDRAEIVAEALAAAVCGRHAVVVAELGDQLIRPVGPIRR